MLNAEFSIDVWEGDMGNSLGQICIILVLLLFSFLVLHLPFLLEIGVYFYDLSLNQLFIQNFESRMEA